MASEQQIEQELKVYQGATGQAVLVLVNADLIAKRPWYIKEMGVIIGAQITVWALWQHDYTN